MLCIFTWRHFKNSLLQQQIKELPLISNGEKTVDILAEQHKVSDRTIKNDAQFARAVDTVAEAAGNDARTALWTKAESDGH